MMFLLHVGSKDMVLVIFYHFDDKKEFNGYLSEEIQKIRKAELCVFSAIGFMLLLAVLLYILP
jgi:hypothetical protein